MKTKIIELTEDNQEKYLNQVAELEKRVLKHMEENGKIGQLFITGKEDILEYIKSKNDMVMCSVNGEDKVNSAVYITQGQIPFTYNDITKYFKCGENYTEFVKTKLGNKYRQKMIEMYILKNEAFKYAKDRVLQESPISGDIIKCIDTELISENGFDEKNKLRDEINKYMSIFMKKRNVLGLYEMFYWVTARDIFKEFKKDGKLNNPDIEEYEYFMEQEKLKIYGSNLNDESQYYNCNTSNSIEIDTYITEPNSRDAGLARILVFEGIKKKITDYFNNEENKDSSELYLCSTLHQDNLSSKYVSEFFGLRDNLFVNRRKNREREVHICKIDRENYLAYLNDIEDKLIALYGYNPSGKQISVDRRIEVLKEQWDYEKEQYVNLNIKRNIKKDYKGKSSLKDIIPKLYKMGQIKQMIKQLQNLQKGDER